ncbi:YLP motif-containing protein 1-like isoform X2 [Melanaphis sacchari]|uniref:YLP motif-containing protein 1 n=1 Tax=Melanaphis sacchari TaxID=742174 RepID=A0A2H8THC8_9HEMI|nr:YLP motif-containing protein 1-like isoform X2 [Melanaphis sacchari]
MYPTPWTTSVPPPTATKPIVNSYENNVQSYPFYSTNTMQNISINQSLQPNAIDPAMVQKWQEWKRWEVWQQQFQQWQQQTGQISSATSQPMPPPMPSSQSLQPPQPPPITFQNQQYSYHQPGPPLPISNQSQQKTKDNEVGIKRGLELEFQSEKKIKIDIGNNKKEIELNDETEALFEEQFKSWEEQFVKWKEQNKNHPDKVQYLEYEKKWINWRDHLKQKCEVLKKKRELKLVEKKKETIQMEENKLQPQQRLGYNAMMPNVSNLTNEPPPGPPPPLQQSYNNLITPSKSENQIPGLDLASNNENSSKGFLNVSKILPQSQTRPIQTPDDKPFNFPKSIINLSTLSSHPINISHNNINQPTMYQNSPNWSDFNNPVTYNNQLPQDVDNSSISSFGHQTDVDSRLPYDGEKPNSNYNSSQNAQNINYRRQLLEGSYNKLSSETNTLYNKPSDDQSYGRNFNTTSSNFHGYNQTKGNVSDFNNFSNLPEKSNIYQPCLNTSSSKPPSLLSLNLVKPISIDKPGNYMETKNDAPDRYERNWNIADEEDDPENEYMEAHKKFSSEPFDDQNDEDGQFSNKQHRHMYNENHYSREQSEARHFNDDYLRPLSQSRESLIMRNTENKYVRPNSQFSRNINQNYSQEMSTLKKNEDDYFKFQNNIRNTDQRFSMGTPLSNDNVEEYSNEPNIDKNNFISQKGNYELTKSGPFSRENYESSKDRPPLIGNYESSRCELSSRGNFDSFRGRSSSRGNYDSFRGGLPLRGNHNSSRGVPFSRGNFNSFRDRQPSRGNFSNNTNKPNIEWNENYTKNEELTKDLIVPLPTIKQLYEEAQPIDPVKIFDYRHLPTLKVIPGLSKETVVPIRIYDYKHGGKRILPWQDRGYSRRNSNHTRDLTEKEDSIQDHTDDNLSKNKEIEIMKPTVSINDISSDKIEPNVDNKISNEIIEETSIAIDNSTILDDEKDEEKELQPKTEIIDICTPSPPTVSKINEISQSSNRQLLTIETLLCPPGRLNRPSKIVIILRGLPGSGKSHVAKLIKEKELSMGGQAPRILSLDDYFMTEVTKIEIDPETNKKVEKKVMEYEYDSANENLYRTSFIKAFKKKILENYFSFYIIDAINNKVSYYKEIIEISRMNGFTVYIIELESDIDLCIKRNIHNRTAHDINSIMRSWVKTPSDQILLDIRSLLSPSESEMEMEDVSDIEMEVDKGDEAIDDNNSEENKNIEFEEEDVMRLLSCKWTDTIPQEEKMKRLDGLCKKKPESSIKEWLQIPEDYYSVSEQVVVNDGKKRVRWADMEERREQEKMRAIGFVVGQTDWNRMLGRDQGESKLTQTKYI